MSSKQQQAVATIPGPTVGPLTTRSDLGAQNSNLDSITSLVPPLREEYVGVEG